MKARPIIRSRNYRLAEEMLAVDSARAVFSQTFLDIARRPEPWRSECALVRSIVVGEKRLTEETAGTVIGILAKLDHQLTVKPKKTTDDLRVPLLGRFREPTGPGEKPVGKRAVADGD